MLMFTHRNANNDISHGRLLELASSIIKNMPRNIDPKVALEWINNPSGLAEVLEIALSKENAQNYDTHYLKLKWLQFYMLVFDLKLDLSFKLPKHQYGFNGLVIVHPEITENIVYSKCIELFEGKAWSYSKSLTLSCSDKDVAKTRTDPYGIWIKNYTEANMEHPNISCQTHSKNENIYGMTLLERLLLELKYFWETGEHLDTESLTLCYGNFQSRSGHIPYVSWTSDGLEVGTHHIGEYDSYMSIREVIR